MGENTNGKVKKDFGISAENNLAVEKAIQKATLEALKKHKVAGNSIAVWKDGKVVLLSSDEINLELK